MKGFDEENLSFPGIIHEVSYHHNHNSQLVDHQASQARISGFASANRVVKKNSLYGLKVQKT